MSNQVVALAALMPRRLALLDIGARDGLQRPWHQLAQLLTTVLVEPDPDEAARLRGTAGAGHQVVIPHALWRTEADLTLGLAKARGCSSVLRPNVEVLNAFPDAERFTVEREVPLRARTLDGLRAEGQIPTLDFAKIDTQGAELAILEGGRRTLNEELVGLEVEVEFARMYVDQPLFSDVEIFVREALGLGVWDIRKTYWKHRSGLHVGAPKGRLIFGDALFFRPLETLPQWLETLGAERARDKVIMLVVAALAYGYADYALALLDLRVVSSALSTTAIAGLRVVVESTSGGLRPWRRGHAALYIALDALARAFKPTHDGWASVGQPIGSRKRGPFWT